MLIGPVVAKAHRAAIREDRSRRRASVVDDLCCDCCGGPLQVLGSLGDLVHFRCRNCGADSSRAASVCLCGGATVEGASCGDADCPCS